MALAPSFPAPRRWIRLLGRGARALPQLLSLSFLALAALVNAEETARVKRVLDGDTILLEDGRHVRYLGINTPEFGEPYSRRAKEFNASLVRGRTVRLEFDQEFTDTYNRLLAYVYVGPEMANARLLQEGLAHAFFIGPARKHNDLFLRLQSEARAQRLGIWSGRGRPKALKITRVYVSDPAAPQVQQAYVRIACLSSARINLAGHVLENGAGQAYRFPAVPLEPGETVIVTHTEGTDGLDPSGQLVVHWTVTPVPWHLPAGTAYLRSPDGQLVDSFHYRGQQADGQSRRSGGSPR